MIQAGKDEALVAGTLEEAMMSLKNLKSSETPTSLERLSVPAVKTISEGTAYNLFLGCLPAWMRPLVMSLPSFRKSSKIRKGMGTMAVTAVVNRVRRQHEIVRNDFLTKLLESREIEGQGIDDKEVAGESLSLLVAGSDTTSKYVNSPRSPYISHSEPREPSSAAAITFYLAQNRKYQMRLQQELDKVLGPPDLSLSIEDGVTEACLSKVRDCQYLQDVINEGLRMQTTACFGLPRVVPDGGLTVLGRTFPAGAILSTPTLALHRLESVWGDDADEFNPERWTTGDRVALQRAFAPFSIGPRCVSGRLFHSVGDMLMHLNRACLGRNLAQLELLATISSIFHRYDVVLGSPDQKVRQMIWRRSITQVLTMRCALQLESHEAFLRTLHEVPVGVRLRRPAI